MNDRPSPKIQVDFLRGKARFIGRVALGTNSDILTNATDGAVFVIYSDDGMMTPVARTTPIARPEGDDKADGSCKLDLSNTALRDCFGKRKSAVYLPMFGFKTDQDASSGDVNSHVWAGFACVYWSPVAFVVDGKPVTLRGNDGKDGIDGTDGVDGKDGDSAYASAIKGGMPETVSQADFYGYLSQVPEALDNSVDAVATAEVASELATTATEDVATLNNVVAQHSAKITSMEIHISDEANPHKTTWQKIMDATAGTINAIKGLCRIQVGDTGMSFRARKSNSAFGLVQVFEDEASSACSAGGKTCKVGVKPNTAGVAQPFVSGAPLDLGATGTPASPNDAVTKAYADAIATEGASKAYVDSADAELASQIATETDMREFHVQRLDNELSDETTARETADTALQNSLQAEATARTNTDIDLQNAIQAETSARQNTDNNLQEEISLREADVARLEQSKADATALDGKAEQADLQAEINARTQADEIEKRAREADVLRLEDIKVDSTWNYEIHILPEIKTERGLYGQERDSKTEHILDSSTNQDISDREIEITPIHLALSSSYLDGSETDSTVTFESGKITSKFGSEDAAEIYYKDIVARKNANVTLPTTLPFNAPSFLSKDGYDYPCQCTNVGNYQRIQTFLYTIEELGSGIRFTAPTLWGKDKTVQYIESAITTKADTATVEALTTVVDGNTQSIATLNIQIATKANTTALTQEQTARQYMDNVLGDAINTKLAMPTAPTGKTLQWEQYEDAGNTYFRLKAV